ncbi:hypothetical protein BX666DRAFT_1875310 [Dichotomocladium elegans]|nr:hypothetical protein BX666DRAFT_1875310 [Dichotomocladium elegans]
MIFTNLTTMTELAAVLPQALDSVYRVQSTGSLLQDLPAVTKGDEDRDAIYVPVRTSLTQYMLPHVIKPLQLSCPHLFLLLMSPPLLQRVNSHPELSALASDIYTDQSLYKCVHTPHGLFSLDVLAVAKQVTPLSERTQLSNCTISNVYWNLVKTTRLLEQALYTQAYVNIGQAASKAFTLQLHKPNPIEGLTALEAELLKRIFWSLWLYDTQIALLIDRPPSIRLTDIHIDRPQVCEGMIEQDLDYTGCLRLMIETRWMRIDLRNSISSFKKEKDKQKQLNMIIQHVRQLRKLYEHTDDKYKINMLMTTKTLSRWHQRGLYIFLLEHALNWVVLFDSFLPVVPDPSMLAEQLADIDLPPKYLCQCPGTSVVHKLKAYASLRFILALIQKLNLHKASIGEKLLQDITNALDYLRHVNELAWDSYGSVEHVEIITKYLADWRPSCDPLPTYENGSLFANESTTVFTVLDMLKASSASTQ